jgi:hypothetical protein
MPISPEVEEEFRKYREMIENYRLHGLSDQLLREITNHEIEPVPPFPPDGDPTWARILQVFDLYRNEPTVTDESFRPWIYYIKSMLPQEPMGDKRGGRVSKKGRGIDPEKTRELIRQTIDVLNDCYAEVQAEDFPEGLGVDVESYIDHNMLDAVNRLYGQPMTPATHVNRIPLRLLRRYDDREIELMLQRLRRLLRILKSRNVEQIEDEIEGKENRPPTPPPPPTYPPTDQTPLQDITNVMGTGMCYGGRVRTLCRNCAHHKRIYFYRKSIK